MEILTLARVEAKKEVVRLAPVRMWDLVETTTALVAPWQRRKG
jgi:hypothetical protein